MTDELATKAPENDAAEQSPFLGDSVAQEGPTMGDHCVTDRPTPAGEKPTGELTKINAVDVYVSKPTDYPHSPSKLLLLLTGGTGIASANNQIQADKYASEGFLVVMPDQFGGDPAPNSTSEPAPEGQSILEKLKLGVADTAKAFLIDFWLARHTPAKVLPILHKVIDGARDEFADAIANGGGIYGVGYCFGAKYALLLGGTEGIKTDEEAPAAGPVLKAIAIAHGTQIVPEDIANVKVPTCLICVENDPLFPGEVLQAGQEALEKSEVEHEVKVYPEVPHGFAVLGDYKDGNIKAAQQTAFAQMLGWLQGH